MRKIAKISGIFCIVLVILIGLLICSLMYMSDKNIINYISSIILIMFFLFNFSLGIYIVLKLSLCNSKLLKNKKE